MQGLCDQVKDQQEQDQEDGAQLVGIADSSYESSWFTDEGKLKYLSGQSKKCVKNNSCGALLENLPDFKCYR